MKNCRFSYLIFLNTDNKNKNFITLLKSPTNDVEIIYKILPILNVTDGTARSLQKELSFGGELKEALPNKGLV